MAIAYFPVVYKPVALLAFMLVLMSFKKKELPHCKFRFAHFRTLSHLPGPSDIVYDKQTDHCFIVSDHGMLFECDTLGNVLRKAPEEGQDFEGVEVTDSFVYVSDETPRKIYKYLKSDLSLVKTFSVSWGGAANKAFESIAWNPAKKCFILVSEAPVVICEYNNQFKELERYSFHGTRDVSGARWHEGYMYLAGNKDAVIIKCSPDKYEALAYYNIDVPNPEGIAFDAAGHVKITSDDLTRLYFFKSLPTQNIVK